MLADGVERADHGRQQREADQEPAHPFVRSSDQEDEAHESVEPGLVDHAGHQRRDVRGGGGVGARQPRVEREERRLQREARDEQHEDEVAVAAGMRTQPVSEAAEFPRVRVRVHHHERGDEEHQSDVRRDEIVESGEADLLVGVVPDDELPRGERGDLPAQEKDERVVGRVHVDERERRHVEQREVHADVALGPEEAAQVADGVDAAQQGHRQRPRQEEGAERVDPDAQRAERIRPRQLALQRRAAQRDRQHRRQHEHGGKRLRHQPDRRARGVAQGQQADGGADQQQDLGGEQCVHRRGVVAVADRV